MKKKKGKDQKVEIKDKIPEYTTYVDGSASDGGVYKDGEITWTKENATTLHGTMRLADEDSAAAK